MKDFFERHDARLEVGDIQRFARVLIDDLSLVLGGYEFVVRLLDSPQREAELSQEIKDSLKRNQVHQEEESTRLHLPVSFQGRPLAVITAEASDGLAIPPDALPLLPNLVRLSLEKILLYKINVTDHETGLNNADFLQAYLRQHLKKAAAQVWGRGQPRPLRLSGDKDDHPGLSILVAEVVDFGKLAARQGRLEAARVLRVLAGWMKASVQPPYCLARLDNGRLGLILPQQDSRAALELAGKVLERLREDPEGEALPPLNLAFGLVAFPADFAEEPPSGEGAETAGASLLELTMEKVNLALRQARENRETPVFSYRDVLRKGGRVVQVLPFNRVVVNIGRTAGVREGQLFILRDLSAQNQVDYKGEVRLFDVRDDFAVGEVFNLKHSTNRPQAGDRLELSQAASDEAVGEDDSPRGGLDPLVNIPNYQGFVRLLSERLEEDERFALFLVREDGYDEHRTTMGHLESDRCFKGLFELLQPELPDKALAGRFSADSLVIFAPSLDEEQTRNLGRKWLDNVVQRHPLTASAGAAVFPCGSYARADILTNAQKALEHAALLGPGSMALFDSVSLNVSGDKLFESGDLDGATQEYQKALELNPGDLNVLNSLGVCYGYRQQQEKALETFALVLEKDPDNLMGHFNRGFALATAGRREEALESLRRAAAIDGRNFDVLLHLGKLALEADLVAEALSSFVKAANLEDRDPEVFRYLGQTYLKAGRTDEAVDAFKAACRHDPEDAPSLSQLGVLFMDRNTDPDVALSLIRQSVELDQTNSLFRQRLARALAMTGDLSGAEAEYRRALEMGARSREIYHGLGLVLKKMDRPDEARLMFREALVLDQEFKPALEALAEMGPEESQ